MAKLIWVQSINDRVGLYERHLDHPRGEAFVVQVPVQVALTPAVQRALKAGSIREVDAPQPAKPQLEHKTKQQVEEEIRIARQEEPEPKRGPGRPRKEE